MLTCGESIVQIHYALVLQILEIFNFLGVHSIQVALLSEMATVEFDEQITDSDILTSDIASLGFDVTCMAVTSDTQFSKVDFKVHE